MKTLTQGFVKTSGNSLSEEHLKEIHDNSLILLYRLLFILYAEHRDLLPLGVNRLYTETYSLDAFKKEVANRFDKNEPIAASTFGYWNKLKELFEIINKGNRELGVPPYNGGLFDPDKHHFLEKHRVGDSYVAKAIDLLSRSRDKAYIDYGSLEIRHLGSIYEGLLEYKLKIAAQDLVPIKDKGKEVFVSLAEAKKQKNKIREDEKIQTGEIYLVTDKGERKATGSYYTPGYIVKYIVENTLGPLVEEKQKKVSENIDELKQKVKGAKGGTREFHERELRKAEGSLIDEILSLKVLDPAMGSGHFLVEATDFLARELLQVLSGEPLEEYSKEMVIRESAEPYGLKEPEEEDIRWARREVVERCIFGVDLNPMAVELAKLSLWLYTVAKGKPLNFLDHHLKLGNSLIGAKLTDIKVLPKKKGVKKRDAETQIGLPLELAPMSVDLGLAVGDYQVIGKRPTERVQDVKEKEKIYRLLNRERIDKWRFIANIWTSSLFGLELDQRIYKALFDYILGRLEGTKKTWVQEYLAKSIDITRNRGFFHWELEFPEVFFNHHGKTLPNPGFDAVVGNPPWGFEFNESDRKYLRETYLCIIVRMVDSYMYFIKQALECCKIGGFIGQIVPNPFLTQVDMKKLRKYFLDNTQISCLINMGDGVFGPELANPSCVFVSMKVSSEKISSEHEILVADIRELKPLEKERAILTRRLPTYKTKQEIYQNTHNNSLITKEFETTFWLKRLQESSHSLKELLREEIQRGISADYLEAFIVNEEAILRDKFERRICKPVITGHNVSRFGIEYLNEYIFYLTRDDNIQQYPNVEKYIKGFQENITCKEVQDGKHPWFALHRPRDENIFKGSKLIGLTTSDRLILGLDSDELYAMDNLYVIHLINKDLKTYHWILSILNSSLLSYLYRLIAQEEGRILPQVKAENLYALPIRHVSFVTPEESKKKLTDEAKDYYESYLKTGKPDTFLYFIDSRLMKEHKPDLELVKKHNATPLYKNWKIPEGALWEQSDVVHDILAYLAEQMIEMSKEKQKEINGFLKWLESQLRIQSDTEGNVGFEALTGKTQIKNYLGDYQKGEEHFLFEDFWKILEKNKARIQANLKSRELYETIRSEYEKSLSKLLPLKEKLQKTDWLIDQIVYKLYGLNDEEIKIVEGHT